jgi:hypothetical protein
MVAIKGSGGTADEYGGKYLDERKRSEIIPAENPAQAVRVIMNRIRDNRRIDHSDKNNDKNAGLGHDNSSDTT